MGKSIVINQDTECAEVGVMENGYFYWESGKRMPAGFSKGILKAIEEEDGDDLDQEDVQCMSQVRNPMRELQCREARGEVQKHRFLLEADWPTIIIGLWLYMFPFLIVFAAFLLEKAW